MKDEEEGSGKKKRKNKFYYQPFQYLGVGLEGEHDIREDNDFIIPPTVIERRTLQQ